MVKKVKKDEALANYKLQMANLLQTESRIRRLFRDVDQVFQKTNLITALVIRKADANADANGRLTPAKGAACMGGPR